jgi:DNA-binding FadR family transcriptional regulator
MTPTGFDRQQVFLLSLADAAATSVTDALIAEAKALVDGNLKHAYSEAEIRAVSVDFEAVAPATDAGCLANILNAGWRAFHNAGLWQEIPQIRSKEKALKELILKSIEVFEYEQLLKVPL